jgi:hypothetical protein
MRPLMEGMVWIEQGDDDVHIQQGTHGLHALLVLYRLDVVQRDDIAAGRQHGDTAAQARAPFRGWSVQTTARQFGNDLAGGAALALRQFLGGLQNIVLNVQSRSHASDAIASLHQGQERLSAEAT